jgi:hypothetical protein
MSTVATLLTGKERLPIDKLPEIWSLFHSIKPIVKLVDGLFLMNRHATDAMKIEDICICLRSLPLSST